MSSWLQEEFFAAKSLAAMLKLNNSVITSNFFSIFQSLQEWPSIHETRFAVTQFSERNISLGKLGQPYFFSSPQGNFSIGYSLMYHSIVSAEVFVRPNCLVDTAQRWISSQSLTLDKRANFLIFAFSRYGTIRSIRCFRNPIQLCSLDEDSSG